MYFPCDRQNLRHKNPHKEMTDMAGAMNLGQEQADLVASSFAGRNRMRNRAIWDLGRFTGERIGAILQLRVGDVFAEGWKPKLALTYRGITRKSKGKKDKNGNPVPAPSRTVKLNPKAIEALLDYVTHHPDHATWMPTMPLFQSQNGRGVSRTRFHCDLAAAIKGAGLEGKISSHSMRKTFAMNLYRANNHDIRLVQVALGHSTSATTEKYLAVSQEEVDAAVMAL